MLHLFHGADSFTRAEALRELRARLDADGMLETNTAGFDGRTVKLDQLLAACDTVPFLAPHRLVIVEGLLAAQEGTRATSRAGSSRQNTHSSTGSGRAAGNSSRRAGAAEAGSWLSLAEYLPRMPETTELVLLDGPVKETNHLLVALREAAAGRSALLVERRFDPPRGEALGAWIEQRVVAMHATIQPRAAALLAETVGPNLWQLQGEIDKLTLYAYGRPIEPGDVKRLVSAEQAVTVFQLIDAVMAGHGDEALRTAHLLLEDGAAGPYLLTMLAGQVRQVLLVQDLLGRGVQRPEIARRLGIRHDFVLRKLLDAARRFPPTRTEAAHARILEADLNIKRGIQDEETAVELLVAELAEPR